ncbi:scarecrow-like protein 33 [Carya illinoinensis]|uniref:Uncharacterized protein n=1 Tax=Carya illinoinensis TaxID=32201 RepID=A0A8T1NM56_CARIL|nr:scarecrow-like protein 33 [Carya illinoinensis]KAG6631445.1 hypothetical protein CIPAW_13G092200 [Carya illinoinensis]
MDQSFHGSPNFIHVDDLTDFNQHPNLLNDHAFNVPSPDLTFLESPFIIPDADSTGFAPPMSSGSAAEAYAPSAAAGSLSPASAITSPSSSDDSEFSETVLKFMSQILMEENIEEKPSMFYDPLGLQSTEKSFYDALGQEYPPPNQHQLVESPDDVFSGGSSDYGTNSSIGTDPHWLGDIVEYKSSFPQATLPGEYVFQPNSQSNDGSQFLVNSSNILSNTGDGVELLAENIFTDTETMLQFRRGLEEASKFLPSGNQLGMDMNSSMVQPQWKGDDHKVEKGQMKNSPDGSRGRKNPDREAIDMEEGRSNKQSAIYVDDDELSEIFDRVLLSTDGLSLLCCNGESLKNEAMKPSLRKELPQGGNGGGKSRAKKQGKTKDTVDLRSLLILCAQAVSTGDNRTANELLKQIRQNSSPYGDGGQRLAHFMANGLEARLAGTGTGTQMFYSSLTSKISAYEMLKAYNVLLSACPFKRVCLYFSNKMIYRLSEKATSIHIIDFGVGYGFQWPILIHKLSKRPGGPPKLRITGIDCPLPGFRPTERIEETGRRLAKYCERFNVPFEYHAIASQNWETIQIEDLRIDRNEMLAVNCLYRFKNLLDETDEEISPRNAVLNLIRRMNPDVFVHSIVNGAYNAPFFVTRFREALFHFSALYDVLEVNMKHASEERLMFEREFYGREAMNAIACEGSQRVERPETYKQWHGRTTRAGFKPLPLNQELVNMFKSITMEWYHKDFVLDEDNRWLLLGWKGRIVYACSCWVPA